MDYTSRRKTHEEYVEELKRKNPDVEVIDKYVGGKTPILHHCKIHNVDWYISPSNVLKGGGCVECRSEKIASKKALPNDEYVRRVSEISPNIKVLEPYISNKKRILHMCTKHNNKWMTSPGSVLQGCGCPECAAEKRRANRILSNEEYIERVKSISPHIVPVEPYKAIVEPILHMCTKHNVKWITTPASILQGCGCIKCKGERIKKKLCKTLEEYNNELESVNPNVICIGEYNGSSKRALHKCKICDREWWAIPTNLLRGHGCPKCSGGYRRTNEEFIRELEECNSEIELIGEFVNMTTKTLFRCEKDGHEWFATPHSIIAGISNCPQCSESKGEKNVRIWLEKHNIPYEWQKTFPDCRYKKKLYFDFYLPELNAVIEYDGMQHYKPIGLFGGEEALAKNIERDRIKDDYCASHNIKMLRIPYSENINTVLNNFIYST